MALVYLNTLAHGRSGDKGDTSNVCVYARDPKDRSEEHTSELQSPSIIA